jgi:CRISPR-associated protein Csb2
MRLGCDVENGDGATVHYLWRIPDGDWPTASTHADLLCREARHVVALGWGIDQAVADARILADGEAASLTGKQWRAWRTLRRGSPTWRVPVEGSLDDLDGTYASFVRRIDSETYSPSRKVSRFDTVHYLGHTVLPPRPYAAFELPEGTGFRTGDVAMAAAMLRSLTCRCAMSDTHDFPGGSEIYVAGHVEQQDDTPARFSYLPLPTIGREHADAMVRRMLVAEPMNGDGTHAQWAQQRLLNATLRDQDGCDRAVLLDLWRSSTPRMLERYVGEAQIWCTVTPVILPGFDDAKQRKAERLLLAAVTQAGIPISAIDGFVLRKAPFWSGAMHPRRYNVPAYLRHLPAWHVWVRFCEAVPGPLAIGAGRHVGLGLFAVAEEAAERSNEVEIRAARSRGTNLGLDSIRARWRGSGALGFQRRCA